jgi:hypothetical protein
MQITQADARTVRIEKEGVTALLRYSLYQNQDERLPESITCRGEQTVAYFLTATIRDSLLDTRDGFAVVRRWVVIPEGELALSFCLDFPQLFSASYLIPGVEGADAAPREGQPVDGSLASWPNALCLFADRRAVLIFSDPPLTALDRGSVELARMEQEEERILRVTVRFPPGGIPAASGKPERRARSQAQALLHSAGDFEHGARLNVLIVPASELFRRGASAVLSRLSEAASGSLKAKPQTLSLERTREELQACLQELLVSKGGVCGLRSSAGSQELSASAGAGLAYLLAKLYPDDEEQLELALELADFCLKAQHPEGLFYERYSLPRADWMEQAESSPSTPSIEVASCARTARSLLELVGLLRRGGLPHGRYLHAATRAVSAMYAAGRRLADAASALDPVRQEPLERGIGVLAMLEPLRELLRLTARDQYRKALAAFRDRFFPARAAPAASLSWPEAGRQSSVALQLARSASLLSEAGFPVNNLENYFSGLLPWIYLNGSEGEPSALPCKPVGGILETLGSGRLLFRGFEACYLLARLNALLPFDNPMRQLKALPPQMLAFTLQQPPGTAFLNLSGPPARTLGALEASIMVSELYYRLKLQEEFPELLRRA